MNNKLHRTADSDDHARTTLSEAHVNNNMQPYGKGMSMQHVKQRSNRMGDKKDTDKQKSGIKTHLGKTT